MTDVIWQPQGLGTTRKEGASIVGRPVGDTGVIGTNYTLDTDVKNTPTTGSEFDLWRTRLDDYGFWTGGTGVGSDT